MNLNYLYGTAWKEDQTADCVFRALKAGYKGIDTANQRKHYFEAGVGEGLKSAYNELGLCREDLFLQTKFTYERGQDHRLPYDINATPETQVQQSFESSLEHLDTDYIDSLVLHGPDESHGITQRDLETWAAFENLRQENRVKELGISNVSLEQLQLLLDNSKVPPKYVQNRCFAETYWDREIREFCSEHDIVYQGFSLLTANSQFLCGFFQETQQKVVPTVEFKNEGLHPDVKKIVARVNQPIPLVIFKFALQAGMLPLTGTTSNENMELNLLVNCFELNPNELQTLETIAFLG